MIFHGGSFVRTLLSGQIMNTFIDFCVKQSDSAVMRKAKGCVYIPVKYRAKSREDRESLLSLARSQLQNSFRRGDSAEIRLHLLELELRVAVHLFG